MPAPQQQQPSNPVSDRKLNFGYWMATHRDTLHQVHVGFWIVIAATTVFMALFNTVILIRHRNQTNELLAALAAQQSQLPATKKPDAITAARTGAVFRTDESIDAYIHIINSNEKWAAIDMEYEVFIGGQSTGREHVTLAPTQEKYVTKTNIPYTGTSLPSVRMQVIHTEWKKISNPALTLPQAAWEIQDPALTSVSTDDVQTQLTFTLRNKSVYGYREPQVVVLLVDDARTVYGIGSVYMNEIHSLESKPLTFVWPKRLPTSLTPQIIVNVDQLTEERIIRNE